MIGGVLLALGASVCWALANVTIQRSGRAVGPYRALLWAQLVGGTGIGVLAFLVDRGTAPVGPGVVAWAAVAGVSALLAYVCLFAAFERGRLSLTVPVMSSWAVLSAVIGVVWLGERLHAAQAVGAVLVMAGVVAVARASVGAAAAAGGGDDRRAFFSALGAAVGFGVLVPAIDQLSPAFGRLGAIAVVYGLDIVLGLPLAAAFRASLAPPPRAAWPSVAAAGLFETVGFACLSLAARQAPVAVVAPAASLSAAFTVLYAWIVLRERPGRVAAVGAALATAGIIALSR